MGTMEATVARAGDRPSERHGQRTGGELVIDGLAANGVETVFGIPGVHTLALYDALRGSPIRHVLARHEQGAGFMADGYARASGRPGVAVVITGPGVTNIATPIGQAYTDSSPVLVISSNVERSYVDQMRGNLHDLKDQRGVMAAVTQWTHRVEHAGEISAAIADAFRRLTEGRPLPVHLEFPLDVLDEPGTPGTATTDVTPDEPDERLLARAVERITTLRHPVIYAGGGAIHGRAGVALIALAERLGAPILTSIMGKGAVPEDHPLVAGALWSPGNPIDALMREADGLLVFGSKLGYQATDGFRLPLTDCLVRVDIDPDELERNAQPAIGITGDAGLAAGAIEARLAEVGHQVPGFGAERIGAAKAAARANAFGIDRLPYLEALRRAVPRDGIVAWDMTMMSYVACGLFPVYEPRTFFFPAGYGTLGFALPAAIGAKIARPASPVVAVCGDGGFQFTMAELGTAVHERLGLPVVIFDDSTYSAVKDAQAQERDGRFIAVDLVNPDYVDLARAYRVPGVYAPDPASLEREVTAAFDRDLPTLIVVPTEPWV